MMAYIKKLYIILCIVILSLFIESCNSLNGNNTIKNYDANYIKIDDGKIGYYDSLDSYFEIISNIRALKQNETKKERIEQLETDREKITHTYTEIEFLLKYIFDYDVAWKRFRLMEDNLYNEPDYYIEESSIFFGSYKQDSYPNNAREPLEWIVLSKDTNKALLMSKRIIEFMKFDEEGKDFEESSIRNWLNNDFYNNAFNNIEKELILETNIKRFNQETNKDKIIVESNCRVFLPTYNVHNENSNPYIFDIDYLESDYVVGKRGSLRKAWWAAEGIRYYYDVYQNEYDYDTGKNYYGGVLPMIWVRIN